MSEVDKVELLQRRLVSQLRWLRLSYWIGIVAAVLFASGIALLLIGDAKWSPTLIIAAGMLMLSAYCHVAANRANPDDKL